MTITKRRLLEWDIVISFKRRYTLQALLLTVFLQAEKTVRNGTMRF